MLLLTHTHPSAFAALRQGSSADIKGFHYMPMRKRWPNLHRLA